METILSLFFVLESTHMLWYMERISFLFGSTSLKVEKKIYMIYREQTIYSCSWVVLLQCKMQEPFSILLPPDPKRARTEMAIHSNHPCQFPRKLLRDSCTYCSMIKGNFLRCLGSMTYIQTNHNKSLFFIPKKILHYFQKYVLDNFSLNHIHWYHIFSCRNPEFLRGWIYCAKFLGFSQATKILLLLLQILCIDCTYCNTQLLQSRSLQVSRKTIVLENSA